jgi:hypothetical protein
MITRTIFDHANPQQNQSPQCPQPAPKCQQTPWPRHSTAASSYYTKPNISNNYPIFA